MSKTNFTEAAVGVHSIDHFALSVPDIQEEEHFLNAFGLGVERKPDRLLLRAAGSDQVWGIIVHGPKKKLEYVSMNCYSEDLESIRCQIRDAGGEFEAAHTVGSADGFWFRDPDGILFQVKVGAKTQPDKKAPLHDLSIPANVRGAPAKGTPTRI